MSNRCCGLGEIEAENTKKGIELLNTNRRPEDFHCPFTNVLPEEQKLYEYKGQFYCILHLPLAGKKECNLDYNVIQDYLTNLIKARCSNFNFISIEACGITLNRYNHTYSFIGAHLKNLYLGIQIDGVEVHLDFSGTLIEGDRNSISCPSLYRCDFLKSTLQGMITIKDCNILDNINFRQAKILGATYASNQAGIYVKDSTVKDFIFTDTLTYCLLSFENCSLDNLHIEKSKFLSPLSLHQCNIKRLTLPKKCDYMDITRSVERRNNKKNKEYKENILDYQYKNFRDLYNILKEKGMRKEMSDYYCMQQMCFEKKGTEDRWTTCTNRIYRWTSNYGQDIKRSIPSIFIFLIFAFRLNLFFTSPKQAMVLPFEYIISPSSLFQTESIVFLFFSILEFFLFGGLIAIFFITLRWNFKKE